VTDEQHRLVEVQRQLVWWFYAHHSTQIRLI